MAPTILVIGATGNTGKSVVRNLPKLLSSSKSSYQIVGLTRSLNSSVSKKLAELPGVEMREKDWTTIDAAWLQSLEVVKVYIAPHNMPNQFVEESALYVALLNAGVKYVVKVSTNVEYIGPTNPVYYGRTHWAMENLLTQPEFKELQWTSLQPNFFTASYLASAVSWIKSYKRNGKQETLATNLAADVPVAMINPEDVGNVGAHLLALEDPTPHNQARYVLSGPQDVTGQDVVRLAEQYVGVKIDEVKFEDTDWLKDIGFPEKILGSVLAGCVPLWQGKCSLAGTPTSKEVMELAPPRWNVADSLQAMLKE